jgi:hypothetical protein
LAFFSPRGAPQDPQIEKHGKIETKIDQDKKHVLKQQTEVQFVVFAYLAKDCTAAMGYCMTTDYDTRVSVSPQPSQDGRWAIFVPASYKNMALGEAELTRPGHSPSTNSAGVEKTKPLWDCELHSKYSC